MVKKQSSPPSKETIDFTKLPPKERRVRFGELGALLVSMGAGIVGAGIGSVNPYKAILIADNAKKLIEKLLQVSEEYHSLMPEAWPDGDRKALKEHMESLERSFGVLQGSEERLRLMGWKLDRDKGKMKRIAGHTGMEYFTECVRGAFTSIRRRSEYMGKEKTAFFRKAVAAELASNFSDEELDIRSGAPIYTAIRHLLERG